MGSAARYRWFDWGYQETLVHAAPRHRAAGADLDQPPRRDDPVRPRPAVLLGRQRPRFRACQQYRGLAVLDFDGVEPTAGFTHAWFPRAAFDESASTAPAAFARSGEGLACCCRRRCAAADRRRARRRLRAAAGRAARAAGSLRLGETGAHGAGERSARFAGLAARGSRDGRSSLTIPTTVWSSSEPDGTVGGRRPHARPRRLDPQAGTLPGRRARALDNRPRETRPMQGRMTMMKPARPLARRAGPAGRDRGRAAGDVRVMWYSDGVEGDVIEDLLARFTAENPGINVILDNVAYQVVQEQLPIQLEAGQGPDIARVTNIKALADHWLDLTPAISRTPSTGARTSATTPTGCARTARTPSPAS